MRREEKGEEPTKKTEIMPLFSQAWRNFDLNALRHALNVMILLLSCIPAMVLVLDFPWET